MDKGMEYDGYILARMTELYDESTEDNSNLTGMDTGHKVVQLFDEHGIRLLKLIETGMLAFAKKVQDEPSEEDSNSILDQALDIAKKHGSELVVGSVDISNGRTVAKFTFLGIGKTNLIEQDIRIIIPKGTILDIRFQSVQIVNTKE